MVNKNNLDLSISYKIALKDKKIPKRKNKKFLNSLILVNKLTNRKEIDFQKKKQLLEKYTSELNNLKDINLSKKKEFLTLKNNETKNIILTNSNKKEYGCTISGNTKFININNQKEEKKKGEKEKNDEKDKNNFVVSSYSKIIKTLKNISSMRLRSIENYKNENKLLDNSFSQSKVYNDNYNNVQLKIIKESKKIRKKKKNDSIINKIIDDFNISIRDDHSSNNLDNTGEFIFIDGKKKINVKDDLSKSNIK